jgi:hypothetical protein
MSFCDTKSLQWSGSGRVARPPTSVLVGPQAVQVLGNETCDSRPLKPKAHLNHQEKPGKGKLGRVNANEPSLRLRDYWLSKPMVDYDNDGSRYRGLSRYEGLRPRTPQDRTPRPRSREGTHPQRLSLVRNVAIPLRSGSASRPDDLRKNGLTPQGGQDDPRSERHPPKGTGNP